MNRMSAWFPMLVGGAAAGALSLSLPWLGWLIALALGAGAATAGGRRLAAFGGLLVGAGGSWCALLGRILLTCHPPDCLATGSEPFVAVGLAMLVTGAVLSGSALARTR
jgi:hypothetical protein